MHGALVNVIRTCMHTRRLRYTRARATRASSPLHKAQALQNLATTSGAHLHSLPACIFNFQPEPKTYKTCGQRASLVGDPKISDFLPPLEENGLSLQDKQASAKPATRQGAQVLTRTRILTPPPKKSFHKRCCSFAGRCTRGEGDKMVGDFECQKITTKNDSDSMSTWGYGNGYENGPYENTYELGV